MAQIRAQVAIRTAGGLAIDDIVNTVYFDTDVGTDFQSIADDLAAMWTGVMTYPAGYTSIEAKLYNMADPKPREPRATKTVSHSPGSSPAGPREVALCLSYFAGRNLPRLRGRIYLGPFQGSGMGTQPTVGQQNILRDLAEGLSGIGGPNVQWVQYSPTTGNYSNVTDYWIDNEWDTVRSRGLKPTSRVTGTVDG